MRSDGISLFVPPASTEEPRSVDIVPMQACHLLLGTPWININDVVHKKVANRYSFNYNRRKITLKSMTATEILEADLERAERRNNEPFRKEWILSKRARERGAFLERME